MEVIHLARSRKRQHQTADITPFPTTWKSVEVRPLNPTQRAYLRSIRSNDITIATGSAGTGKTYLSALMAVKYFTEGLVKKIIVCRPAVNAGDEKIGFLPGTLEQKMDPYLKPVFDAFETYWSVRTIKDYIADGKIEIIPLAFMRGRRFKDSFILIDEAQNVTKDGFLMVLTRFGEGRKMVISGDPRQTDVNGFSGLTDVENILRGIESIEFVHFGNEDVVRHPIVASILRAWPNNGITLPVQEVQVAA